HVHGLDVVAVRRAPHVPLVGVRGARCRQARRGRRDRQNKLAHHGFPPSVGPPAGVGVSRRPGTNLPLLGSTCGGGAGWLTGAGGAVAGGGAAGGAVGGTDGAPGSGSIGAGGVASSQLFSLIIRSAALAALVRGCRATNRLRVYLHETGSST